MSLASRAVRGFAGPLFLLSLSLPLAGQCDLQWQPGAPVAGIAGTVADAALLANGDIVVGGTFTRANAALVANVARWNGTDWLPLGTGVDGGVSAVVEMPNGDIVVGGAFTMAGGTPASRVARWNGAAWSPLGSGVNNVVNALLVLPNGDLLAAGQFTMAGGVAASRLARWDGVAWSPLTTATTAGNIHALTLLANGNVAIGGSFASIGGVATQSVAIWNGTTFTAVPGLAASSSVFDVEVLTSGVLVVTGGLWIGGNIWQVAVLAGPIASPLVPPPGLYNELLVLGNGDIVAAGYELGMARGLVARWNGSTWTSFGAGAPGRTLALRLAANGDLVAAGMPLGAGVTAHNAVARWNGTTWTSLGAPRSARINAMARMPNGDVVVGGDFTQIGGVAANHVARWHGGGFTPLGLGLDGPVQSLAVDPDGDVVVCGAFTMAGGGPATRIARWNGSSWSSVGAGLAFVATEVAAANSGQVLARSTSEQLYFDGFTWGSLVFPMSAMLTGVRTTPEGDFVLGGVFSSPQSFTGVLRFDHGVFSYTEPQPFAVTRLGNDNHGRVLAHLSNLSGGEYARLDGNTWTSFGYAPMGVSLTSLPNGDPLVLANVASDGAQLFRYDGTTWLPFSVPLQVPQFFLTAPLTFNVACSDDGTVFLGGELLAVQGAPSVGFARAVPGCPATATTVGTGCIGTAGPLSLATNDLPWLGDTFTATASGLTTNSLGVHAFGDQPTSVSLPLGAPGCSLFVVPTLTQLLLPANGEAEVTFALPRNLALAGLVVRSQVVGLEFDPFGTLLRLTSTNALSLTTGGF